MGPAQSSGMQTYLIQIHSRRQPSLRSAVENTEEYSNGSLVKKKLWFNESTG